MERPLTEQKNSRILGKGKTAKKEKNDKKNKKSTKTEKKRNNRLKKKKTEKKKRRNADQGESNSCMSPCPLD